MQDRLLKLLTHFGFTATRFADEIGVQRSGISHILSGRNLPSHEFILKIMKRFPEISLDWLLLGKGDMLKPDMKKNTPVQTDLFGTANSRKSITESLKTEIIGSENSTTRNKKVTDVTFIEQIVIFYSDGTCRTYYPATTE
jgi:transcriptional regulator with XRE-family HTH domain